MARHVYRRPPNPPLPPTRALATAGGVTHQGAAVISAVATVVVDGTAIRGGVSVISATATVAAVGAATRAGSTAIAASATVVADGELLSREPKPIPTRSEVATTPHFGSGGSGKGGDSGEAKMRDRVAAVEYEDALFRTYQPKSIERDVEKVVEHVAPPTTPQPPVSIDNRLAYAFKAIDADSAYAVAQSVSETDRQAALEAEEDAAIMLILALSR